jgi:tRNA pseudouridine55 synthase
MSNYVLDQDKTYEVTALLGVQTDSYDTDGKIVEEKAVEVSLEQVQAAVSQLSGVLEIRVPIYSAVKVQGKKLYDRARADEVFEAPLRSMDFKEVELISFETPRVRVKISCSKGSYIRSWVHELGVLLGTGATVEALRRLRSEPYSIENAISVEELGRGIGATQLGLVELRDALPDWMLLTAEGQDARLLTNGTLSYKLKTRLMASFKIGVYRGAKVMDAEGKLLALLEFQAGQGFTIRRVFRH